MVCACFQLSIRTLQNWEKQGIRDKRKGAVKRVHNKLSDEEVSRVIQTACSDRFKDLTPHEIVPLLAEEEKYLASTSSFYRFLGNAGLLHNRIRHTGKKKKASPVELKATAPYEIMSWDISWLKTDVKGRYYYLYMVIDIWSRYIIGWRIHEDESGALAKELFNSIASQAQIRGAVLHSDNGGPMICSTMRATLEKLGVLASFSRPSVSNDNAYSESLFKTLKYKAGYPKYFTTLEQAREWVAVFVDWYNHEHRHSRIGYVTPYQRLTGADKAIFAKRNQTFSHAKNNHPERWSRHTKVWETKSAVILKKGNIKRKAA
jgi:putative transposase